MKKRIKAAALVLLMFTVLFGCASKQTDGTTAMETAVSDSSEYFTEASSCDASETLTDTCLSTADDTTLQDKSAPVTDKLTTATASSGTTTRKAAQTTAATKATVASTSSTKPVAATTAAVLSSTSKPTSAATTKESQMTSSTTAAAATGGGVVVVTTASTTATTTTTTTTTKPTTASAGSARVYISCINAVNDGIRDKEGYSSIPSNGVMLDMTVDIADGDTAESVVNRAAAKAGLELKIKRGYIEKVGVLEEKDCGSSSGWLYSVNNVFPMSAIDKYKPVNNGDVIRLLYSVKLGDIENMTWG